MKKVLSLILSLSITFSGALAFSSCTLEDVQNWLFPNSQSQQGDGGNENGGNEDNGNENGDNEDENESTAEKTYVRTTGEGVYIRPEPNTECTPYEAVTRGSVYEYVEDTNAEWRKIVYGDTEAYVSATYSELVTEEELNGSYVYCQTDNVNIRKEPSTDAGVEILGTANKNDPFLLLEEGDTWHKVRYQGEVAYVYAQYFAKTPVSTNGNTGNSNGGTTNNTTAGYDYFVLCTGSSVNIRKSASTSSTVLGQALGGKCYQYLGSEGDWDKIYYRYQIAYIHTDYTTEVKMPKSSNDDLENVLSVAYQTLGTPYVYGAVRYHGGLGTQFENFDKNKMDCSSLVQYVFYKGAKVCMGMNTTEQQAQGSAVSSKANLKRGDVMFFTSPSYASHSLPYKIRHVGIYLGNDYMLHTANTRDNAVIIKLSEDNNGYWWNQFVLARRFL